MAATIFPGHAALLYWLGTGGNSYWNNAFNWTPTQIPANGDTLFFPFGGPEVNTNNIVGLTLNQICFAGPGGGNDIRGDAFTLTNGIEATNTSGMNIIENNITLAGADQLVDVTTSLESIGIWSGNVGVVKSGAGTLIYFGDYNSYTGTTTVNGGTLQLDCFELNASFAGPLLINAGTVQDLANEEIPGNEPITINAGGTLDLNNLDDQAGAVLTLNGNGSAINGNPFILNATATVTCNPGLFQSCTISGSLAVGNIACAFSVSGVPLHGSLLVPANVTGSGVINKTGSGFLSLSGSNSFSGQLNIGSGTVGASGPFALGLTNAGTTVSNAASLDILNCSITNEPLTVASTGLGIQSGSGANTWLGGPINLITGTTFEIDGTSLDLQSTISGPGGFTKTGAGTLVLSGPFSNTYGSNTVVSQGVLQLEKNGFPVAATAIPGDVIIGTGSSAATLQNIFNIEISPSANVTVNSNGVWDMNFRSDHIGPNLILNGNAIVKNASSLLLTNAIITANVSTMNCVLSGAVSLNGNACNLIVNGTGGAFFDLQANIGGAATINKTGAGFVSFDGNNTFSGQLNVLNGTLEAFNSLALGSTNGGTTVSNTASLWVDFSITNEPLTIASTGVGFLNPSAPATWVSQSVTLAAPTRIEIDGPLFNFQTSLTGPGGFTKTGAGTLALPSPAGNSYSGGTTINAGVLLPNSPVLNGGIPGNVIVNSGGTLRLGNSEQIADSAGVFVNAGGLFDFNGNFESVDTLNGAGSITFGTLGYLVIGGFGGTSEFDGVMSGVGFPGGYTVAKVGAGTFTMTANNTYSNATDIDGGTLVVDGDQHQSPIGFMAAGSLLRGAGTVGDVSATGVVAPGLAGSPAILTSGNVAFNSAGVFMVELKGPAPGTDYDQLSVRGTNALGNATLTVIPAFTKPVSIGQQFVILTNDFFQPPQGQFNGLPNGTIFNVSGYYFRINYNSGSTNDVVLTLFGVPDKTVTLNSVTQGWYDSTGLHNPGNNNYSCGEDSSPGDTNLYRNWFVFNAPLFAGSIVHAELIVNSYVNSSPHGQETYLVRSVSTPVTTLEAGGSGLTNIYNDLGDGPVYAIRNVSTNETDQRAIIPLNVKFINDITAAAGGQIALGGSIVSLDPTNNHNQYLFGFSGGFNSNDVQLRLTFGTATTLNAANTGWYDATGSHSAANSNYFAGTDGATFYHDFFVYNLPVISGPLVNAQLLVNSYGDNSPSGRNTYQVYDVTTPLSALTNSASGATNTYADLASGILYGGRDVYVSESGLPVGMPLDTAFVSAVHAHSGGPIALGGVISSLTPSSTNEWLFGGSAGNPTDAQLWLGFLSAPAVTPVFLSSSSLGNSQFQFTLTGTSGTSNEIQGSFDFQNWDYIADLAMTNTTSTFTYTNNTTVPYRFFRAKLMP